MSPALRPILDDDGTLTRSQEMKALLNDLQESLVSCQFAFLPEVDKDNSFYLAHQVTDILRAKILHQASQLADSQARVKELEEQSLAKFSHAAEDNKQHIALLADMGEYLSSLETLSCLSPYPMQAKILRNLPQN
jgi:hypothetical protein